MKTLRKSKSKPKTGDSSPIPVLTAEVSLSTLDAHTGLLDRAWGWLKTRNVARSSTRRLRVAETVSLGEKRFVAVVQVDGRHFLIAGGPTNIALLAQLDPRDAFEDVLKKTLTVPRKQVAKGKQPANVSMQTQVNRTNSQAGRPQKTTAARSKQPAKRAGKQNAIAQRPASAPITHLNGAGNFDDVLQKTMSISGLPGNEPRQNSKSSAQQTGYYA